MFSHTMDIPSCWLRAHTAGNVEIEAVHFVNPPVEERLLQRHRLLHERARLRRWAAFRCLGSIGVQDHHFRFSAVKRPRVTSAPDTILFDSVPYAKRKGGGRRTRGNTFFLIKRPGRDDDHDQRRQRLRIDAVDGGFVYASLGGCDEDCDVVESRLCPHPSEWDAPPVVMDVDWGPLA